MNFKNMEKRNPPARMNAKTIIDELGRKKTLLHGDFSYIPLDFHNFNTFYSNPENAVSCRKKQILFLGLGAELDDILPCSENKEQVFYLEHSAFAKQISHDLPENFQAVDEKELPALCNAEFFQKTDILFYKQNLQLFPGFWNALLIRLRSAFFASAQHTLSAKEKYIFLTGGNNDLLHRELCQAIQDINHIPVSLGQKNIQEILELTDAKKPVLYLSVNAQSLDNNGLIHEYLKQKNIPLVLWFVDNVWNILSRFSQAWWKECAIFLTDFSFASQLRKEGAKKLFPLPLASHSLQAPYADLPQIPLFFVGNSSFANKNAYFSGCKLEHDFEQNIYRTIQKNFFEQKELPDFHSIRQNLLSQEALWQNKNCRTISYAATKADLYLRKLWLENLSPLVHIMGDNAWQDILATKHTFYPPADYYKILPSSYKNSLFTLNLTSLLMPANLSQRHFDVWKHHGFLLSSPSEGMEIFPQDIQSVITVHNPQDCLKRLELLLTKPNLKTEIQKTMQNEIARKHQYTHRLQFILEHA